jgi:hypothetical protein
LGRSAYFLDEIRSVTGCDQRPRALKRSGQRYEMLNRVRTLLCYCFRCPIQILRQIDQFDHQTNKPHGDAG